MESELEQEKQNNQKLSRTINIKRHDYEELIKQYANDKEVKALDLRRLEAQLYTEEHTRTILKTEKDVVQQKVLDLKNDNQSKGRILTKEKYHNQNEQISKQRLKQIDEV